MGMYSKILSGISGGRVAGASGFVDMVPYGGYFVRCAEKKEE